VFAKSHSVFKIYVATLLQGKVEASGPLSGDVDECINEHNKGLRCLGFRVCKLVVG